ncbi:MAG TPA: peptidoglycan editing factor PgeF [Bacteroidota bacterium]|nr:peptidoglycan editing factor PgeF [Bacteroidota bacterium]
MEIIRSEILSRYHQIVYGMSTRNGGMSPGGLGMNLSFNVGDDKVNVIENRRRFFSALHIGLDELAFPMQCHSANVKTIAMWGGYENCDGLITGELGVFIAVSVADCVPIFLFDPVTCAVAGIHAGWRGTSAGIVRNAVSQMQSEFHVEAHNLVAFVGPAAGKCCYEVGVDVAQKFDPQFVLDTGDQKWKVDLKGANVNQLIEAGVRKQNIEQHEGCTIHESERFHSYRRDGRNSGRMMAVIGIVRT